MGLFTFTPQTFKPYNPEEMRRVLVLDGNPNLRHLYTQALLAAGYEVIAATNIQEARNFLNIYDFDVFLTDSHFDTQDHGVGLLYEQMDVLKSNNVKTIMVSSYTQYEPLCQELNVDSFIEKPVAMERLVAVVDRLSH